MPIRTRVAVLRNSYNGEYLTMTGRWTMTRERAMRFQVSDGVFVQAQLRSRNFESPYKGLTLEWLPKRPRHTYASAADVAAFLDAIVLRGLEAERDRYLRLVEACQQQAIHARTRAEEMAQKAKAIQMRLASMSLDKSK